MASKSKNENVETEEVVETKNALSQVEGLDTAMNFFKKYQNYFFIGIIAILLGVIAYSFLGKKSDPVKALKADGQMQYALQQMSRDSFDIALNGDAQGPGLLAIIKKNSGTTVAKAAKIEAAVCYLKTNRPKEAIKLLEDATGFGPSIDGRRLSLIGDAKAELATETATVNNKLAQEAIGYYEKASNALPEDNTSAIYLYRAAQMNEKIGKNEEAKKIYAVILDKYPENRNVVNDTEKSLGKLGELK